MFERIKTTQLWWRLAISGGFIWFMYWAYTQPTEFDEFIKGQKEFVDDLYEVRSSSHRALDGGAAPVTL